MGSDSVVRRGGLASLAALLGAVCIIWAANGCDTLPVREEWDEDKFGPLVPHETFPGDCSICHLPDGWDTLRDDFDFDHGAHTGFVLEGAHAMAACLRCHNDRGPVQAYIARGCGGCHMDPHKGTLGKSCERCHEQVNWEPGSQITEHSQTRFPLMGAHMGVPCESCHKMAQVGEFRGESTECEVCHANDARTALMPNHVANGWVRDCEDCHTVTSWEGARFDHSFFPLVGGHASVSCSQCHTNGMFTGLTQDCASCHADDALTASIDHSGFSRTCTDCHTVSSWSGASFDHSFFPLTLGHAGLSCVQCHTSGTTGPIPSDCVSCHADDAARATPDHSSFSRNCTECHSTAGWSGAGFDHSFFPLVGGHGGLACARCHGAGNPGPIPSDCASCHAADAQTATPDHSSFPRDCSICHTITTWTGATFDHSFFPLTGGHAGLTCERCHGTTIGPRPSDCFSCHSTDYQNAQPDHANFSRDCTQCHTTTTWSGARFDHSFFPLTNGHAGLTCQQCHGATIGPRPSDCNSCHSDDYQRAPEHVAAGLPRQCEQCHTTVAWASVNFTHRFPITSGPHRRTCSTCHLGTTNSFTCFNGCHEHDRPRMDDKHKNVNGYTYTSTACVGCHPDGKN